MSNMPKFQYILESKNNNFSDAVIINLKPKTAQDIFTFKPGQYAMLSFYDVNKKLFINHPFSIASSPLDNNLEFGIRIGGLFTQTISQLPLGTQIDVLGPFGNFVFDETKQSEAVFIAGGVGVTPFISAIKYAVDKNLTNKLTLIYSTRKVLETLFYEDIKQAVTKNSNLSVKLMVTNEHAPIDSLYCENGKITKDTISCIDNLSTKDFFLCGPGSFMKAMENNLVELGVAKNKIHQEAFSVTPNLSFRKNWLNITLVYGFSLVLFIVTLIFVSGIFKESEVEDKYETVVNQEQSNTVSSSTSSSQTVTPVSVPQPRTTAS